MNSKTVVLHAVCGGSEEFNLNTLSHGVDTAVARDILRRKALHARDEISGLIAAVALGCPSPRLQDLEVSSAKKKWKVKACADGTDHAEMARTGEDFGAGLWEYVGNVIPTVRSSAPH